MKTIIHFIVRPYDEKLFIYTQILHVSSISTSEQTFQAKFYFRVTWVQKIPTKHVAGEIPIEGQIDWPSDVYRPSLGLDNSTAEIEYKCQTLGVSKWRKVDQSVANTNGFAVMEWKARGSGVFFQKFELRNYPCDTQLLKIVISSLDQRVNLHDDKNDKVVSIIRKDYFVDQGFHIKYYEELLNSTKISETRGEAIISREDAFMINQINKRFFNTLTYLLPAERIDRHVKAEILHPVTLITLATMSSFLFQPSAPEDRLSVSVTMALVITGYAYVITGYLPRTVEPLLLGRYVYLSFWFVFLVLFQNAFLALITCEGRYCGLDLPITLAPTLAPSVESPIRFLGVKRYLQMQDNIDDAYLIDKVFMIILFSLWFLLNIYVYVRVYYTMRQDENERIVNELNLAKDGDTDIMGRKEYVRNCNDVTPKYKKIDFS